MSTFKFCETLGGTPIIRGGTAPAAGFRIGGMGGQPGGPYVITNDGAPLTTGKTYNDSGEFIEEFLNLVPGSTYKLELRENLSLEKTDNWELGVEVEKPTIDSVSEANGGPEIAPGGITEKTLIDVIGTAKANEIVRLLDQGVTIDARPVGPDSQWKATLNLSLGYHSLSAQGVYESNPESYPPRTFEIVKTQLFDEDFERYSEMDFPIGDTIELRSMFVTALPGSTMPPQILHRGDLSPVVRGKMLYAVMNRTGTTRFDFKSACSSFRVGAYLGVSLITAKFIFRTYDSKGELLEVRLFDESHAGPHDLLFSGRDITRLEVELIKSGDVAVNLVLDTFRFNPE